MSVGSDSWRLRMLAVNNRIRKIFEDPKTTTAQKKKLCESLAEQFNEDQLPEWCTSEGRGLVSLKGGPVASPGLKTGNAAFNDLEGGRRSRRRRTVRRKTVKRRRTMRRRSKK